MLKRWKAIFSDVPVENEDEALEEIARRVVREGMGTAVIVFLESMKPIGFIAGQTAIAATPLVGGFIEPLRLERYATLLGNRDFIERLITRIEELEMHREGNDADDGETSDQ